MHISSQPVILLFYFVQSWLWSWVQNADTDRNALELGFVLFVFWRWSWLFWDFYTWSWFFISFSCCCSICGGGGSPLSASVQCYVCYPSPLMMRRDCQNHKSSSAWPICGPTENYYKLNHRQVDWMSGITGQLPTWPTGRSGHISGSLLSMLLKVWDCISHSVAAASVSRRASCVECGFED